MKPSSYIECIGPFRSCCKPRLLLVLSGRTEEMEREELSRDVFGVVFSAGVWRGLSLHLVVTGNAL